MYMQYYNLFLLFSFFLMIVYSFYSTESFINSNATTSIELTQNLPISRIEMVCVRNSLPDELLDVTNITLLDSNDNLIDFWELPNQVSFSKGTLLQENRTYKRNQDAFTPSFPVPDNIIIQLNPEVRVGSIQITNRKDCCFEMIKKYDLKLYNQNVLIASKPLTNLGENGKSVTYIVIKPGARGLQGEQGGQGMQGIQGVKGNQGDKGDKGDKGLPGLRGVKGDKGDKGEQGLRGETGLTGATGLQGLTGERGLTGSTGLPGAVGEKGAKG